MSSVTASDKKREQQWQAETDARTMAQYQEIISDKARMGRAIKEANKQAQDLTRRASVMKSAASMKSSTTGKRKK